jgi:DNA-binding YbaB/EbfC family protein
VRAAVQPPTSNYFSFDLSFNRTFNRMLDQKLRGEKMEINPFDLLKNAQKFQEQMGDMQEKLDGIKFTGSAGGGMVEIDMNGKMEVLAVRIAPEAMDDREMLEDLLAAAFSATAEKFREGMQQEVGAMFGGMGGIPGFPGGMPGFPAK